MQGGGGVKGLCGEEGGRGYAYLGKMTLIALGIAAAADRGQLATAATL